MYLLKESLEIQTTKCTKEVTNSRKPDTKKQNTIKKTKD